MLRKIITQAAVAKTLKALAPLKTPIIDRFYPHSSTYSKTVIGVDEIYRVVRAVPVVKRGGEPVVLGQGNGARRFIEVMPVEITTPLAASDINDLLSAGDQTIEAFLAEQVDFARRTVRSTAEALAAQSLGGAISWAIKGGGTYDISFGTLAQVAPSALWSAAGTKLGAVVKTLNALTQKIQEQGFGSEIAFDAGANAYEALFNLVSALPNDNRLSARIEGDSIAIGTYRVYLNAARYYNPIDSAYHDAIGANEILAWDKGAGFEIKYLAVDNLAAKFAAVPLFLNPYQSQNGKGWNIDAESKPLPIPVVKAMAKAVVVG